MKQTRATGVFTITTVIDGENAIVLDLSNDMDMVQTDSALKVTTARTIETIARLYDGASEVDISGTALTISGLNGLTCNQESEGEGKKGRKLTIAFAAGTTIAAAYDIVVSHSYPHNGGSLPLSAELTIAASKDQPLFQLKPSHSALPCARNAETNALGNPPALSMKVVKIDGQSSDEKDATSANLTGFGVTIRYSKSSMPTSKTGGGAWPNGNSVQALNTDTNVYVAMFDTTSGVLLDRETIPVLKDGEHGDGIVSITRTYNISKNATSTNETTAPTDCKHNTWQANSPAVTDEYPCLWCKEVVDYKYKADTTKYYFMGKKGDNGIDAQDCEWVYIRTKTNVAPVISDDSTYTDHNGNNYTKDDHLPKVVAGTGGSLADIESDNSGVSTKKYECTDDPKGVDDTYKYEWEIKRTKGRNNDYGSRSWQPYSGTMTLHNNLAESVFQIDLDNEEDQFGTDSDSKVLVQQKRSTGVQLYYGTEAQQLNANNATVKGITAVLKYSDDDTDVPTTVAEVTKAMRSTTDYTQGIVEVTVKTGTFAKTGMYALVTATCARGSKTARFTLTKLMSGAKGENPVIYQLAPTQKSFSFSRAADNSLTPDSRSSQINVAKTEGNTTTVISTAQTGITYKWGWDTDSTAQASGLAVGTSISVSKTDAASHSSVWVELSTGDRETLPIVKDGTHGDDAQYIYLKGTAMDATSIGMLINCAVKINGGTDQAKHQRGLNLVTVNRQTLAVVESINYDTYGEAIGVSGASGITDLIAKLNALDDTVFVCLVSYDAVGWSTALITALQNYGLSNIPYTSHGRYPFLFIGYKGLGIGNGLMRMRSTGPYTDVVELSVYIANGALSANDPMGIKSADVYYAVSPIGPNTQGNVPADNLFYTNFPTTLLAGNYVWEATMITYTNNTTELTGKVCLGPTTDYLSGTEVYAVSDSNTTPPAESTDNWKTTYEKTKGKYLWSATRVQYTDNSYGYLNKKCIGYWGEDGKSITKKSETYRYGVTTTAEHPTETGRESEAAVLNKWYNDRSKVVGLWTQGRYLWTETTITWTNGVTDSTTVLYSDERNPNDGVPGQDIIVNGATVMKYYVGDSNTIHPAEDSSDWKDISQVTQTQGKWLWSKATTYYKKATDGTSAGYSVNYNVSYISKDGKTGRGIKSTTELYQATDSSASRTAPTSDTGWDTDPNLSHLTNKWTETYKYLWNCEKTVYSNVDGTESTEYTVPRVIAIWTKDGNAGKGVDSITNYYCISDQSTGVTRPSVDGTSPWDDDPMAPTASQPYLWNYEKITWVNYGSGSQYTYTEPRVIGHFGKDGGPGDTIWQAQAFKRFSSAPGSDKPSVTSGITAATTDFGNGWQSTPPADSSSGGSTVTIGSGTTTDSDLPVNSFYNYSLTQQIYKQSEIGKSSGTILKIAFYNGGSEKTRNLNIYLVNTTKSSFGSTTDWIAVSVSNLVFSGSITFAASAWTEITLSTPFAYNGNNLALIIDDNTGTYSQGLAGNVFSANNEVLHAHNDSTNFDPSSPSSYTGTLKSVKNQIKLTFQGVVQQGKIYSSTATVKNGTVQGSWSNAVQWEGDEGQPGGTGKRGRFLWYAGKVSDIGGNQYFTADDNQAPYVDISNNDTPQCYAYVGSNTTMMFPSDTNVYTNPANGWEEMSSEHKFLISQAIFSKDAHLGSFVISGDWQISTQGWVTMCRNQTITNTTSGYSYGRLQSFQPKASGTHIFKITANVSSGYSLYVTLYNSYGTSLGSVTLDASNPTKTLTINSLSPSNTYYLCAYKSSSYASATIYIAEMNAPSGYLWFSESDPTAQSDLHFAPNFAVDGLTGEVHATIGTFKGTMTTLDETVNTFTNQGSTTDYYAKRGVEVKYNKERQTVAELVSQEWDSGASGMLSVRTRRTSDDALRTTTTIYPGSINMYSGSTTDVSTEVAQLSYDSHGGFLSLKNKSFLGGADLRIEGTGEIIGNVGLPSSLKTSSFTLPEAPSDGMILFCKGTSSALTITTKSHPIMARNSNDNWCDANSSATIPDRDSVILIYDSLIGKWLYFSCD